MERRQFILNGAIAVAGTSIFTIPLANCSSAIPKHPLLNTFLPKDIIDDIGSNYIKGNPDFEGSRISKITKEKLRRSVYEDFKLGKTVISGGWIVAETEAQYCAFLYLSNK